MASNEEIIRNLYAVAEKEPKRFRSLFTKNGYWWDVPAGVKYRGDEVARAADIYSAAFPDMHRELSDLHFDGDVVVVQLSLNGTHQGDLPMGLGTLPATGKEFHVPCIDVFHVEGSLCCSRAGGVSRDARRVTDNRAGVPLQPTVAPRGRAPTPAPATRRTAAQSPSSVYRTCARRSRRADNDFLTDSYAGKVNPILPRFLA